MSIWEPKQRIEDGYRRAMQSLIKSLTNLLASQDITDPNMIPGMISEFFGREDVQGFIKQTASQMVTMTYEAGYKTWREAARASGRGQEIYNALFNELQGPVGMMINQLVQENAALISTFPFSISESVNGFIAQETFKGRRAESISKDLVEQFPDVSRARINLIARTETSKASTALTQSRADNLGLAWYIWRTSKDQRVRPSHKLMDRVMVAWDDPASPEALAGEKRTYGAYAPGNIFNCRCYPQPLIRYDDVSWPCKIYHQGRIEYMTRKQFQNISVGELAYAA